MNKQGTSRYVLFAIIIVITTKLHRIVKPLHINDPKYDFFQMKKPPSIKLEGWIFFAWKWD